MNDARRADAILSSDPRAWEKLVEDSSPNPISGRVASGAGSSFTIGETLQYTAVPTTGEVDRVHSKLVALRDAVLVPARSATDDNPSLFDNFEAKNSSHSGRWGGWLLLPPWSVFSLTGCPLAEVRKIWGSRAFIIQHCSTYALCSLFLFLFTWTTRRTQP